MTSDIRLALRLFLKNPGFALAAILTLALGIGANTAIFSIFYGVLLRPAPVDVLERIVVVWETDRDSGTTREPASVPDFLDFRQRARTLAALAALMGGEVNFAPAAGDPTRLAALYVSHDLLPMMGVRPIVGRTFTAEEDRARGPQVALISQALWTRSFDRDPGVVGRAIRLDDLPYTILGVMPGEADFGVLQILSAAAYSRSFADRGDRTAVDVWIPLQADPTSLPRDTHPILQIGRLADHATAAAAQQEMAAIAADLEHTYPSNTARGVNVEPLSAVVFGPVRPALMALLGAVALVLLVACVNVANLLLARGAGRAREVAVRRALGASGSALAHQFLAESVLLALAAAAVGSAFAWAGVKGLVAIAPPGVPRLAGVTIDLRVLAATFGASVAVGIAFGLVPILQARRVDLLAALKAEGGSQASAGPVRARMRGALVIVQFALAVMLVSCAGLLIKSFWRVLQVDSGFRAASVLKVEYQLPASRYPVDFRVWPNFAQMHAFTGAVLRRVAALPGVEAAAIAGNHPLDPGFTNSFTVVGREAEARTWPEISVRRVTPGYFRAVGLALLRGRLISESDTTLAAPVLLVNEAAARRFFPGGDPIGARITFWGAARTIVGVVANERFHGLTAAAPIAVYAPLAQAPSANGAGVLLVRTSGDPSGLAPAIRGVVREVDPALAVFGVETLDRTVARSVSERRFTMLLVVLFAAAALALAAVGLHGVLSFSVAQRTREIGIRIALGARPSGVVGLVVLAGLRLMLAGLAIGLAGAIVAARLLSSLLYEVAPGDPAIFAAVAAFLAIVSLAASYLPARRASRVDPIVALRNE